MYVIYQNEGAEWRILVPGCVDFLGRMWTARLFVSCPPGWVAGRRPTLCLGKGERRAKRPTQRPTPATHPSDPPPRSYRPLAGVRYLHLSSQILHYDLGATMFVPRARGKNIVASVIAM